MLKKFGIGCLVASFVFVRIAAGFLLVWFVTTGRPVFWGITFLAAVAVTSLLKLSAIDSIVRRDEEATALSDGVFAALACAACAMGMGSWFWLLPAGFTVFTVCSWIWRCHRATLYLAVLATVTGAIAVGLLLMPGLPGAATSLRLLVWFLVLLYVIPQGINIARIQSF